MESCFSDYLLILKKLFFILVHNCVNGTFYIAAKVYFYAHSHRPDLPRFVNENLLGSGLIWIATIRFGSDFAIRMIRSNVSIIYFKILDFSGLKLFLLPKALRSNLV